MSLGIHAFVSYAREDSELVDQLVDELSSEGLQLWVDRREIEAGQPWEATIERALASCDQLLVCLTPEAVASKEVLKETAFALDEGKTVFPVILRECSVPSRLQRLQHIDLSAGRGDALGRLVDEMQRAALLEDARVGKPPPERPQRNRLDWGGPIALGRVMVAEARRLISQGVEPDLLCRGIRRAADRAAEAVLEMARVADSEQLAAVAATASGDSDLGSLIAEALEGCGAGGIITVEEEETEHEATGDYLLVRNECAVLAHGYPSPRFVTDPDRLETVLENPRVLVCDQAISGAAELEPIVATVVDAGEQALAVFAPKIETAALAALVMSKVSGRLPTVAIGVSGPDSSGILEDVAVQTGSTMITAELGRTPASVELGDLGRAEKVIVDATETTLCGGGGNPEEIRAREQVLYRQESRARSADERSALLGRIANLRESSTVIRVEGHTKIERRERMRRVRQALEAAAKCVEMGSVPGGGVALLKARKALDRTRFETEEEKRGGDVVRAALGAPLRVVAAHAGPDADAVGEEVDALHRGSEPSDTGYDPRSGRLVDMVEAGILEPATAVKAALERAAILACRVLTAGETDRPGR
ncbi:MAG: TIR domain-containing protein [Acidobacteriota bacterium]|nr:TIR domain-containing protein [Acidobacteriota bacterium]MDH3522908.1 TIR domain-containing protein [Acidobacteriota bacterium]